MLIFERCCFSVMFGIALYWQNRARRAEKKYAELISINKQGGFECQDQADLG
jgi:hypothetical protein